MKAMFVLINDDDETTEYFEVKESSTPEEITEQLNNHFGKNGWLAWNWA